VVLLDKETVDIFDAAAAALGVSRLDLGRILITNYIVLIKERGLSPAAALRRVLSVQEEGSKAPATLPAGVSAQKGGPNRGNEPQLMEAIEKK